MYGISGAELIDLHIALLHLLRVGHYLELLLSPPCLNGYDESATGDRGDKCLRAKVVGMA